MGDSNVFCRSFWDVGDINRGEDACEHPSARVKSTKIINKNNAIATYLQKLEGTEHFKHKNNKHVDANSYVIRTYIIIIYPIRVPNYICTYIRT